MRMPENQALAAEASDLALRIRERFADLDKNSRIAASTKPIIPD